MCVYIFLDNIKFGEFFCVQGRQNLIKIKCTINLCLYEIVQLALNMCTFY